MRRGDREVKEQSEIALIMAKCDAVSVAFAGEEPYVIPMSFGFEWTDGSLALYLHGAGEGERAARLEKDSRVAFSMYTGTKLQTGATACAYSTSYESVCGNGTMTRLSGEEKRHGLDVLMRQYAGEKTFTFDDKMVERVTVWRLDVKSVNGKKRA